MKRSPKLRPTLWDGLVVLLTLAVSTVLNVAYFLYTAIVLWLPHREGQCTAKHPSTALSAIPVVVLLALGMLVGIFCQDFHIRLIAVDNGLDLFIEIRLPRFHRQGLLH